MGRRHRIQLWSSGSQLVVDQPRRDIWQEVGNVRFRVHKVRRKQETRSRSQCSQRVDEVMGQSEREPRRPPQRKKEPG